MAQRPAFKINEIQITYSRNVQCNYRENTTARKIYIIKIFKCDLFLRSVSIFVSSWNKVQQQSVGPGVVMFIYRHYHRIAMKIDTK
jgi:hypothetical protein